MSFENVNTFLLWVFQNPLFFLGLLIALCTSYGFVLFFRGLLLGFNQLLFIDGHEEHVAHSRERITHGMVIMVQMFVLWVCIRGIATILGFDTANLHATISVLVGYVCIVVILYFIGVAFPKAKH